MLELTVEELTKIIKGVFESASELKGTAGYPEEENEGVEPKGYAKSESHDFSSKSEEGSLYKRQGNSNMGPFTAENAIRALAKKVLNESFSVKSVPKAKTESSAPFNSSVAKVGGKGSVGNVSMPEWKSTKSEGSIWEDLGRYYFGEGKRPDSAKKKKFESNILQNVYNERKSVKENFSVRPGPGFVGLANQLKNEQQQEASNAVAKYIRGRMFQKRKKRIM